MAFNNETIHTAEATNPRPAFPKRAVITAGMPYGNKSLHFGHVGGVFVPADMYARFLRDRIGFDNVMFVSGTDCYGSPIVENHRAKCAAGEFTGSLIDFVTANHEAQKADLEAYEISLNFFGASALEPARDMHKQVTDEFLQALYDNGWLEVRTGKQFYDEKAQSFLNGRQVIGRCPVQGCKSEKAYADECDLGHQYEPENLIVPKSTLTGETPVMKEVNNRYFKLTEFRNFLNAYVDAIEKDPQSRELVANTMREFLETPAIYVKNEGYEEYQACAAEMPAHACEIEENKTSFTLRFETLGERDIACEILTSHDVRFRTGKTLVPFRLTGNIEWGVAAPEFEATDKDLTIWVWPESLWAPISFTRTALKLAGKSDDAWKDFWCSKDAKVYQFIGQDNIYFYGNAQQAMFAATQSANLDELSVEAPEGSLPLTTLVANNHILFLDKKASSSGAIKPPMARELLDYYLPEQLRAHFLSLGLGLRSVSFRPKPFDPKAQENGPDPALKESTLLSNVFNRLVRSCFYTAQKVCDGFFPEGTLDAEVERDCVETILAYEQLMYKTELHAVMALMDEFIRRANKYWAAGIKEAEASDDDAARKHVLYNSFQMVRVAAVLMHPVVPKGCEMIRDYLQVGEEFWDWNRIFDTVEDFFAEAPSAHALKELPPRTDFFEKHPSQYK